MSTEHHHFTIPQEEDVLPERTILSVLGVIFLVTLGLVLVAWLILVSREAVLRPSGAFPEEKLGAPGKNPSLEEVIFQEQKLPGEILREKQREALHRYQWVDQDRQLVRLPIEEAMERYLKEQSR